MYKIFKRFFSKSEPAVKKMYVLVRTNLEQKYQIVQGSHALAQYSIEHHELFLEWHNETIIYLGVRFSSGLTSWKFYLIENRIPLSCFYEPDQQGQITAIACYHTGELFSKLKLA